MFPQATSESFRIAQAEMAKRFIRFTFREQIIHNDTGHQDYFVTVAI